MELDLVVVAVAAFGGGILSAFLGWLDSHEPWDGRKFGKSMGFALLSALGFAIGYSFSDGVGTRDVFIAILAGAGVDSISNRAIGIWKPSDK